MKYSRHVVVCAAAARAEGRQVVLGGYGVCYVCQKHRLKVRAESEAEYSCLMPVRGERKIEEKHEHAAENIQERTSHAHPC